MPLTYTLREYVDVSRLNKLRALTYETRKLIVRESIHLFSLANKYFANERDREEYVSQLTIKTLQDIDAYSASCQFDGYGNTYVEVKYMQKHPSSRFFASSVIKNKATLASMTGSLRNYLAKDHYVDVDIVNAHPTIIYHLFTQVEPRLSTRFIEDYCLNRSAVLQRMGVTKQMILSAIYTQRISTITDADFVAFHSLLYGPFYEYMSRKYANLLPYVTVKKNNPMGSFISILCCAFETRILQHCLLLNKDDIKPAVLIHDGFLVLRDGRPDDYFTNEFIPALEDHVRNADFDGYHFNLKYTTKPMDSILETQLTAHIEQVNNEQSENKVMGLYLDFYDYVLRPESEKNNILKFEELLQLVNTTFFPLTNGDFVVNVYNPIYLENELRHLPIKAALNMLDGIPYIIERNGEPKICSNFSRDYFMTPRLTYNGFHFRPPPFKDDESLRLKNLFMGFSLSSHVPRCPLLESSLINESLIMHYLNLIMGTHLNLFLDFCAHLLQFPGYPSKAFVLYGKQGCGKSIISKFFESLIGGRYIRVVSNIEREILGPFNSIIQNCLVCVANECQMSDIYMQKLKSLLTESLAVINSKGVNQYTIHHSMRLIATTNDPNTLACLMSENEQRRVIGVTIPPNEYCQNSVYFAALERAFSDKDAMYSIYSSLINRPNVEQFGHSKIMETELSAYAKESNVSIVEQFVRVLIESPLSYPNVIPNYAAHNHIWILKGGAFQQACMDYATTELQITGLSMSTIRNEIYKSQATLGLKKGSRQRSGTTLLLDVNVARAHFMKYVISRLDSVFIRFLDFCIQCDHSVLDFNEITSYAYSFYALTNPSKKMNEDILARLFNSCADILVSSNGDLEQIQLNEHEIQLAMTSLNFKPFSRSHLPLYAFLREAADLITTDRIIPLPILSASYTTFCNRSLEDLIHDIQTCNISGVVIFNNADVIMKANALKSQLTVEDLGDEHLIVPDIITDIDDEIQASLEFHRANSPSYYPINPFTVFNRPRCTYNYENTDFTIFN